MKARFGDVEFDVESEEDIRMLLNVVGVEDLETEMSAKEYAEAKGEAQAAYMGKSEHWRHWTAKEDAIVMKFKPKEALKLLKRTKYAISMRRKKLKDKVKKTLEHWEKFEDSIIKQNVPREAFKLLGGKRSINAIYMRRKTMGFAVPRKNNE